ncbi:hypothetical protein GSI_08801 [Ganoderma sinense ZZ0214-1]|uniref:AB hydrolase-1 domain-containing protein n=1 Tax=Ganoderma sinense ZZ0214-1 TaxID=1077348 RepID=A0A2G8S4V2_9APHY|nr:hypothetical protein GSI_08801 [Ganoderma sinense ZZ0214-1]
MTALTDIFTTAGFESTLIPIPPPEHDPTVSVEIYALRYRSPTGSANAKEPLLLLHGYPENSNIYRRLGPALAKSSGRDIVIADSRGSGQSSAPKVRNFSPGEEVPGEEVLRTRYSKREMARDMFHVMKHFGYDKFSVIGHDRGARVSHRMAADYPDAVVKVMLLDIAPTYDIFGKADATLALAFFHWFFLSQPYPFPEQMILENPSAYLQRLLGRFTKVDTQIFTPEVVDTYLQQLAAPERVHALTEDYRCSAPGGADLALDAADRAVGRKETQPFRVLWGKQGPNERLFGHEGMLALWRNVCVDVDGRAVDCGHYIPEERPDDVEREALAFF